LTQLRFVGPALEALYQDVTNLKDFDKSTKQTAPLPFNEEICLKQVSYFYPGRDQAALKNIDIIIPANTSIGFVGSTGSGKTTTVDVILGLLEPQQGLLSVDGQRITSTNRHRWQRVVGYVPQHIFLVDESVAANIAFGIDPKEVDMQSVERAAKIANLHEFVCNELPKGYATIVGERGVRLSGGQRQRIGIARAFYNNPKVLVLDEATSALDNLTEQLVMEAINNLSHEVTIIIIAHRLSTVRNCDNIILLEGGKVSATGTFDELINKNQRFRVLSEVDQI